MLPIYQHAAYNRSLQFGSDGKGNEYCHTVSSNYNFGNHNLGGFSKSVSPKLSVQAQKTAPKKNPDFQAVDKTTKEQALLYRLSGLVIANVREPSYIDITSSSMQ